MISTVGRQTMAGDAVITSGSGVVSTGRGAGG
jgi:hypothetical protein